jgi:hypothetical protein
VNVRGWLADATTWSRGDAVRWLGIAAAVMLGLGTFMPWFVARDDSLDLTVAVPGIGPGAQGLTVLALAAICVIAFGASTVVACRIAALVAGLAVVLVAIGFNPSPALIEALGLPGTIQIGFGMWVSTIAAGVAAGVGVYGAFALHEA